MSEDNPSVLITQAKCVFPARELRAYRMAIIATVSSLEDAGAADHVTTRPYAQALLSIDRLGLDHEDVNGCTCWHAQFAPGQAR